MGNSMAIDISAAKEIIRIFEEAQIHKDWYGISGIKFIWHGEWADPEIEYKGRRCSCYIVEDTMWERFGEDHEDNPEEFDRYMRENADEVKELCELALFGEDGFA